MCLPHLLDLVARVGDPLSDALVGADGGAEFSVVLNNEFIQITVTFLIGLLQATLPRLPVLYIVTA